jgi:hypothetical protein
VHSLAHTHQKADKSLLTKEGGVRTLEITLERFSRLG